MKSEKESKCNVNEYVEVFGSKWNLLIISHLRENTLRYTELQKRMYGINAKTITTHLRKLEEYAIIERNIYAEVPPRVEYSLTERGKALLPILEAMLEWSKKNSLVKMTDNEAPDKTEV
ncbi:MAG TPA: helix-turn-helix domain-containing protein [Methanosarcina sp.]|nr:helix-turn-helix domain-containing protein [Methanosarcina sp.]